jgi:hypothetical protein
MRRHLTTRDFGFAGAGFLTGALLWKAVLVLLIIAPAVFVGSVIAFRLVGGRRDRIIVGPTLFGVLAARWLLPRRR